MTEISGEAPLNNNELRLNNVADPIQELLMNIQEMIVKNQNEQKKFNEEVLEKISSVEVRSVKLSEDQQEMTIAIGEKMHMKTDKLSEDLQEIKISISEHLGIKNKKQEIKQIDDEVSHASSINTVSPSAILPATGKSFVLKHAFKNVLEMKEGEGRISEEEEHYGVTWELLIMRKADHLGFYLHCSKSKDAGKWSIETEKEHKLLSANRGESRSFKDDATFASDRTYSAWGRNKFIEWEKMEKDYIKDGKMNAEMHVKINKMAGVYKKNLRTFDESMEKYSDVLLVVKDTKFYVSKLYLATHSPYFDTLFLGKFQESKKSEIKLSGIDSDDFQNYLEVLYHEEAIDETTVEGILLVADMYDTPLVTKQCQKFLMEKSEKTLKKKLLMSARYNLDQLKKKCISEIKSTADIKAILPDDIEDMDHSIMAELLKMSLEFK